MFRMCSNFTAERDNIKFNELWESLRDIFK